MGAIDAVIFDWGGTLSVHADVDIVDMWRLAARHLAGGDAGLEDQLASKMAAVEAAAWDRVARDQETTTLAALIAEASAAVGVDVGEALLEEAGTHYLDTWTPHIRHHPECRDALQALRAKGFRLGLLSNTHWPRGFHDHFLERDGLLDLLDARLYTCEMAKSKPHGEAFAAALGGVGLSLDQAHRAVFVGDRLYDDVSGAQAVGMRAVWRPNHLVPQPSSESVEPDATIESLWDLVTIVEKWDADG